MLVLYDFLIFLKIWIMASKLMVVQFSVKKEIILNQFLSFQNEFQRMILSLTLNQKTLEEEISVFQVVSFKWRPFWKSFQTSLVFHFKILFRPKDVFLKLSKQIVCISCWQLWKIEHCSMILIVKWRNHCIPT